MAAPPQPCAHRLRRIARTNLVNPGASGALALLSLWLMLQAASDSTGDTWPGRAFDRLIAWKLGVNIQAVHAPLARAWFILDGDTIRRIDPDNESWDQTTRLVTERPGDVLFLDYTHTVRRKGVWAPTRRRDDHVIAASIKGLVGKNFTPEQRAEARRRFAADVFHTDIEADRALFPAFRDRDVASSRLLALGYFVNALSAMVFGMLLYSLQWIPRIPGQVRDRRRTRALARGRCPNCGYSIAGLPEPKCPECGKPIP